MITCGVCGETANPGSIFCRRCGAELPRRATPMSDAQTTVLPTIPAAGSTPDPSNPSAPSAPPGPNAPPPAYSAPAYPPPAYPPPYRDDEPYDTSTAVFLPADQRPPRRNSRGGPLAFMIGGVVLLVLIAFGVAIALLRGDHSKGGVAQPPAKTSATSSAAPSTTSSAPATSPTPTPTPTPTDAKLKAQQRAALTQLGGLVSQSGSVRSGIQTALDEIGGCKNIGQAISTLTSASNTRQSLAQQAAKLGLNSLPNHVQLLQTFQTSMTESSLADQQYANWGRQVQGSCKKKAKSTSALAAAQVHDGRATAAKNAFAQQWNADAKTLGLPGIDNGSL